MNIVRFFPLFFLWLASIALGAEPTWVFNNGDGDVSLGASDFFSGEEQGGACVAVGQAQARLAFGLFEMEFTGTDATLQLSENDLAFDSSRSFFALRYKTNSSTAVGGLFFTNDCGVGSFTDKCFSSFPIKGDGEWHNLVVDMRSFAHKMWEGTITSFRLDPVNPSSIGDYFDISRLGFFSTQDEANAFLAKANDAPNLALNASIRFDDQVCYLPGGALKSELNREDFHLQRDEALVLPLTDGIREEVVVVRDGEDGSVVEPLCDVSSLGFATYCVSGLGTQRLTFVPTRAVDVDGRPSEAAVRFVLARELMDVDASGAFRPEEALGDAARDALAVRLNSLKGLGVCGERIAAFAERLDPCSSREDVAIALMNAVRGALETPSDNGYSKEYFARDRIRIGAWGNFRAEDFSDDYMNTYADCGFDYLQAFVGVEAKRILSSALKYGVEVCVNDGSYHNPETATLEYCDYPNFDGCYVTDEPGGDDFDKLAAASNAYSKKTGKRAYINLLPMYANAAQLKYGAGAAAIEYYDSDPDLFRNYCAAFCKKFDTDYICTDIYPLNWTKKREKFTYPEYVESINIIASVAREFEREFWCYIQTFAWDPSKRTPNESEYRWQCYSMLSFGCRHLICWTYAGYQEEFPSLVDIHSQKTTAWYDIRPVLWEMRRLSDEYVKYRNLGAFTHNCTEETPYLKMTGEYRDFDAIEEIDSAEPLLVGCFEKKDDSRLPAFTLVNMTDLGDNLGATVRMKLRAEGATAWYRGVPQNVETDENGYFVFHLASGEGVFVTLQ